MLFRMNWNHLKQTVIRNFILGKLAQGLNITVAVPRVIERQVYLNNAPADSPETYYRKNVLLPFLDHILTQLPERFGGVRQKIEKPFWPYPCIAHQL